jgi:cold shock CspA family protein
MSSADRSIGCVKWFNNKAGYGFVTLKGGEHDGKDVFVHYSAIKVVNDQFRYLVQGEYIEFDLTKDASNKHDFIVSNVSGIKGGNLMCEVQQQQQQQQQQSTRGNKPNVVYRYKKEDEGFNPVRKRQRKAGN